MTIRTTLFLLITHTIVGVLAFAGGIYALPILTAPPSPSESQILATSSQAKYTAEFTRNLKGSDMLHWGEGKVFIGQDAISMIGELAPGPNYKLYLSPQFVETEAQFKALKSTMVEVGDINTFDNFVVTVPNDVDLAQYSSIIVWCESFSEFITAAQYR